MMIASTDATAKHVKKYEQEHPNLIKAILPNLKTNIQKELNLGPILYFQSPVAIHRLL